jgi:hypothetical protein
LLVDSGIHSFETFSQVHIVYEKYRDQRSKDYHAKLSYKCIDRVPTLVLQPPVARSKCTFVY